VAGIQETAVENLSKLVDAKKFEGTVAGWKSDLNGVLAKVRPIVLAWLSFGRFGTPYPQQPFLHAISTGATSGSKAKIVRSLQSRAHPSCVVTPFVAGGVGASGEFYFFRAIRDQHISP